MDPPAATTGALVPLESLKVPQLRDRCKALNLPHSGVKAVLVARLGSEGGTPARQLPPEEEQAGPAPAITTTAALRTDSGTLISENVRRSTSASTLEILNVPTLRILCRDRSLSTSGEKADLVARLASGAGSPAKQQEPD